MERFVAKLVSMRDEPLRGEARCTGLWGGGPFRWLAGSSPGLLSTARGEACL